MTNKAKKVWKYKKHTKEEKKMIGEKTEIENEGEKRTTNGEGEERRTKERRKE